jgi:UDP-2,3-diacylglucosamine pyrophosphatase LpxH
MRMADTRTIRTIFLSDLHLGMPGVQIKTCLAFLKAHRHARLVLVGDILDLIVMARKVRWSRSATKLVRHILKRAHRGGVVYVPGNHDAWLRSMHGQEFFGIEVARNLVHTTADGRRFFVTHGDEADLVVQTHPRLAELGSHAYDLLVTLNIWSNWLRRLVGLGPWSLSGTLKRKVKQACTFVSNYELALATMVTDRGLDGVICGHIHVPVLEYRHGILYANCGDWVEHATAVIEDHTGRLELVSLIPVPTITTEPERGVPLREASRAERMPLPVVARRATPQEPAIAAFEPAWLLSSNQ